MNAAHSTTIAVVDSGNDFKHRDLEMKAWVNPIEIPGNDRDEDKNGYPDDVHGWNFAESNNSLIDYNYSYTDTLDIRKFFEIQLKSFLGTITAEDREWASQKLKEEKFIKELTIFGNWMHGTHVSGIAAKLSNDVRILGAKLIATEIKLPGQKSNKLTFKTKENVASFDFSSSQFAGETPIRDGVLKAALGALAKQQSVIFNEIGYYLQGAKADIMNGSFGTSNKVITTLVETMFKLAYRRSPTQEEIKKFTDHYFAIALEEALILTRSAPQTLFIFAAGNEGLDNDINPTVPTNLRAENKISVAATLGDQALAIFSNYGATTVEVAAPGVGILSSTPMDKYLAVSGTSQAAPFVAGVAGSIKEINPGLDFRAVKKIIMETVDVKSWLKGKVATSGMVNAERALRAAELSKAMPLGKAIFQANRDVLPEAKKERRYYQVPREWIIPMPSLVQVSK